MEALLELCDCIDGVKWEAVGAEIFKSWPHAMHGNKQRYTGKGIKVDESGALTLIGTWTKEDGAIIARYTGNQKGSNERYCREPSMVHFLKGQKRWMVSDGIKYKAAA
jgi:hypothetical protein